MPGLSPGSGGPGEVKRNSHVSLVSGGKEDSAMQSSENLRPGVNINHTRDLMIIWGGTEFNSNERNHDLEGMFRGSISL